MNFTGEDKKLENLIDDIRVIIFEIVEDRMNDTNNTEDDFIDDYIRQMREIDAKI